MYYFLSLAAGVIISVMVACNGGLAEVYGVYSSTLLIHVTGFLVIAAIAVARRGNPFAARQRWFLYTGGAIGVCNIVFNNLAFGRISISAILALSLLGQSLTGLVVDRYGWLGMPTFPFQKRKIWGLLLILAGILAMMSSPDVLAVTVSLLSGVTTVVSRTINAALTEKTSETTGTFFNYLTGLACTVVIFFLLSGGEPMRGGFSVSPQLYIYLGGALGVCVVFLSNVVVSKMSALYCTLCMFVGQVFSGMVVDAIIARAFSPQILLGGMLVTAGLAVNLLVDRQRQADSTTNCGE